MLIRNSTKRKLVLDLISGKTLVIPLDANITIVITLKNNKIKRKMYFKSLNDINEKYRDIVLLLPLFITN